MPMAKRVSDVGSGTAVANANSPMWVPSKAVSAVCEGCSFCGYWFRLNDNWALLSYAAWRIDSDSNGDGDGDKSNSVNEFLNKLTKDEVHLVRESPSSLGQVLTFEESSI